MLALLIILGCIVLFLLIVHVGETSAGTAGVVAHMVVRIIVWLAVIAAVLLVAAVVYYTIEIQK